ncbi:minor tail protein [Gordonia phage Lamberg]|uniref:Minor tail protein n=1 Tax=Gordonia phage Lamberg TaxID=2790987 RepID=A0A7T3KBT7_9CAUD|nr:minor tail protein [Gordonia phage Lamberg]QPX62259.1 minor tail protein [Gordonia phage Lamberg]UXE04690.1 minor tail protein [Gordonia phage Nettuno]
MPVRIPGPKPRVENDPLEEFWDNMVDAIMDVPIRILIGIIGIVPVFGQPIANALGEWLLDTNEKATDAIETVVSVGTQVNYVQQIIALQSGMGVWETGPDRTGTPSFPVALLNLTSNGPGHSHSVDGETNYSTSTSPQHRHSAAAMVAVAGASNVPTIAVTATYAPWGNVIFKSAAERKVITWQAYKSGTVSTFNLDVYKLEADGSSTLLYSSPNLAGDVPVGFAAIAWMQHLMATQTIVADDGDIYDVQFRMTGSGEVRIAGLNFGNPTPLPGFRPYTIGSARNPSSTPAPTTIDTTARDAMYTGPAPFVSVGIDVGQTQIPRFFFDDFNRSDFGPRWKLYGPIRIRDGRFQHTESGLSITSGAAMYHQPLVSDTNEVAFDFWPETGSDPRFRASGVGMHCPQGMGAGVWLSADGRGVYLETGGYSYGSRTIRAQHAPVSAGRLILTYDPDDLTYRVYKGGTDVEPFMSWPDAGGIVQRGIGRRWWGLLVTGGFLAASTEGDNVTAADITTEEEEP